MNVFNWQHDPDMATDPEDVPAIRGRPEASYAGQ